MELYKPLPSKIAAHPASWLEALVRVDTAARVNQQHVIEGNNFTLNKGGGLVTTGIRPYARCQ
eukprot:COSAG02_NODE_9232_length_2282_cov_8.830323_2_plen_63_part_00